MAVWINQKIEGNAGKWRKIQNKELEPFYCCCFVLFFVFVLFLKLESYYVGRLTSNLLFPFLT